jgi:hypothetical protein
MSHPQHEEIHDSTPATGTSESGYVRKKDGPPRTQQIKRASLSNSRNYSIKLVVESKALRTRWWLSVSRWPKLSRPLGFSIRRSRRARTSGTAETLRIRR